MNVRQLKAALERFDDDDEVFFSYNYGDRSHTMVAAPVAHVEEEVVVHSAYHNMMMVVGDDERYDDDDTADAVVVLS